MKRELSAKTFSLRTSIEVPHLYTEGSGISSNSASASAEYYDNIPLPSQTSYSFMHPSSTMNISDLAAYCRQENAEKLLIDCLKTTLQKDTSQVASLLERHPRITVWSRMRDSATSLQRTFVYKGKFFTSTNDSSRAAYYISAGFSGDDTASLDVYYGRVLLFLEYETP